jgi:predicted protein tyrosine phosphatase
MSRWVRCGFSPASLLINSDLIIPKPRFPSLARTMGEAVFFFKGLWCLSGSMEQREPSQPTHPSIAGCHAEMKNVLFVCSRNRLRSPTAEQIFAGRDDIEVSSAGLDSDAENPLTGEEVAWADVIFVMEKAHRGRLTRRFRAHLRKARVVCLDIPDEYGFMDPALIKLLEGRVTPRLR